MKEIKARVKLVEGMQFVGTADSGHGVVMDGTPEFGGANTGVRPMELLLIGLGGCTGMDAISILRKKRQHVTGLEIKLKGKKADKDPARYTDVTIEFEITGKNVDEAAVKRAIELSMEKYCSVKATLEQNTKVDFAYTIKEEA